MRKNKKMLFVYLGVILIIPIFLIVRSQFNKTSSTQDADNYREEFLGDAQSQHEGGGYAISTGDSSTTVLAESIFEKGGNAVDAAIAASFSMGVTMPYNGSLGGGGVMLVHDRETNEAYYYDYYNSTGYEESNFNIGIPGFLRGMEALYDDYGSLPVEDLLNPVIQQAEEGVPISKDSAGVLNRNTELILEANADYANSELTEFEKGDIVPRPMLANSLKQVLDQGFGVLYDGESEMSKNLMASSNLSKESLQAYEAKKIPALQTTWQGYDVYASGSPFSGSLAVQMLKGYDQFDLEIINDEANEEKFYADYYTIRNLSYSDHYKYSFDSDEAKEKDHERITDEYVEELFAEEVEAIEDSEENIESENTIGFSFMDDRYVVVGAHTISNYWGSFISNDGFFYNNSLKNLSEKGKNSFAGMKRPRTNLAPLVFVQADETIGVSAAGGNYIPQVISQTMSKYQNSGISFEEAINTQRVAFVRDTFMIEEEELRPHTLINNYPTEKGYLMVDFINEIGLMNITRDQEGFYDSYFEPIRCEGGCADAKNP